ncbi:spermatogenesis-associated protein 2-like protein [Bombina bombina]|uniref:spermatogenesis-associated protein 2-like protein n=1 Tax=Bombina bombina TaxID=8345 RepID=UPI00235A968B|nr:spermatogenesis-associated protein 2-like protein [Bombina bombina]XP_053548102.1 spermatogenesis-associated protein 2-like protein [Bombina bombina]
MSVDALFAQYCAWVHAACDSRLPGPCCDIKLTNLLKDRLLEEPELHGALHNDAFSLIASGLRICQDLKLGLQHLTDAFQVLEQAALNLYCAPWRKEFQTIKTYSGLYVHALESALPQDAIFRALQRLGYELQADLCSLCVVTPPPAKVLSFAALGFFAAQLECRLLSNILSCAFPGVITGPDLLRERRSCRGETACMERLHRLTLEGSTPGIAETYERNVESDGGSLLHQPSFSNKCHEYLDQHMSGLCKEIHSVPLLPHKKNASEPMEAKSHTERHKAGFSLHDCVFSDTSLEQHCIECGLFHSKQCPVSEMCSGSGHNILRLCFSEKQKVLSEVERNRYQSHSCLRPENLPHYRCDSCRQLHYINCPGVKQCRDQDHKVTMIMLERDQRQWLQQSKRDPAALKLVLATQIGL